MTLLLAGLVCVGSAVLANTPPVAQFVASASSDGSALTVRQGKGAKDRTLWVAEADVGRLRSWRERQARACRSAKHVFTTLEGKPLDHRYVQRMVKRYAAKAGIEKNVSPHTLRHTFVTDLYRETSKIRLVQKVLGHSDLSTTMVYTHVFDPEVEAALKSFRQATAVAV